MVLNQKVDRIVSVYRRIYREINGYTPEGSVRITTRNSPDSREYVVALEMDELSDVISALEAIRDHGPARCRPL